MAEADTGQPTAARGKGREMETGEGGRREELAFHTDGETVTESHTDTISARSLRVHSYLVTVDNESS